uniref:Uncharacterized protein n=1 Tax=Parascaris equorum TaxID=6256 RepID=A0A914RGV5_PAREQ
MQKSIIRSKYDPNGDGITVDSYCGVDSRVTKLNESFIINSSCVTIDEEKVGAGNFADVYKGELVQFLDRVDFRNSTNP